MTTEARPTEWRYLRFALVLGAMLLLLAFVLTFGCAVFVDSAFESMDRQHT